MVRLLVALAQRHLPSGLRRVPDGVGLTEFYDVVELGQAGPREAGSCSANSASSWRRGGLTITIAGLSGGRSRRMPPF